MLSVEFQLQLSPAHKVTKRRLIEDEMSILNCTKKYSKINLLTDAKKVIKKYSNPIVLSKTKNGLHFG